MGIKDINKTFKDSTNKIIDIFTSMGYQMNEYGYRTKIPLSMYSGHKVAFDISIILHAKAITANNEIISKMTNIKPDFDNELLQQVVFEKILNFFGQVMSEGIIPIIIFDGQTHSAKKDTVSKRVSDKVSKYERVKILKDEYFNTAIYDRTDNQIKKLKDAMMNMYHIKRRNIEALWLLFENLGIKCLKADHDAEKLCASLSLDGIVSAVYGNDTDNYPLGTNLLITSIYHDSSVGGIVFDCVNMEEIYYCLTKDCGWVDQNGNDVPFLLENLVDLCILHSCDYNNRMQIPTIKGDKTKSVGAVTSMKYIKEYRRLENFPQKLYPYMGELNIGICRDRFKYEPSLQTCESTDINWDLFSSNCLNILNEYNVKSYVKMGYQRVLNNKKSNNFDTSNTSNNFDTFNNFDTSDNQGISEINNLIDTQSIIRVIT